MKRKFLFAFGLISLLSSQAFAMEIVGGKLISHEESTTGKDKAIFKELKMDASLTPKFKNRLTNQRLDQFIYTTTNASTVDPVQLHSYAYLSGNHKFLLSNRSTSAQTYVIRLTVCENKMDRDSMQFDKCASTIDTVELEPNGHLKNHMESSINIQLDDANADYVEYVETSIFNTAGAVEYHSEDIKPISIISPA